MLQTFGSRAFAAHTFIPLRGQAEALAQGAGRDRPFSRAGYARFSGNAARVVVAALTAQGGAAVSLHTTPLFAYSRTGGAPAAGGSIRIRRKTALCGVATLRPRGAARAEIGSTQGHVKTNCMPASAGSKASGRFTFGVVGRSGALFLRGVRNPTDEEVILFLRRRRRRA